ncbi:hypothetical protein AYO45_04845 [Gammaproteobacteria bacterium SCGC AG-212-F23]|nr:hypothetical protein AYO45_04845 [Gammaproteobacteria bacterium SCGC AG-212-F23]
MFSHIPKHVRAKLEINSLEQHAKKRGAIKAPSNGNTIGFIIAFSSDNTKSNGYKTHWSNARDDKLPENIPPGFYSFIQTQGGNFIAMRCALDKSAHGATLAWAGLSANSSDVSAAGEMFVGPNGQILLFTPRSGGYHTLTHEHYGSTVVGLANMQLPTVMYTSDFAMFDYIDTDVIAKTFFTTGKWDPDHNREKTTTIQTLENYATSAPTNILIQQERLKNLNAVAREFLETLIMKYNVCVANPFSPRNAAPVSDIDAKTAAVGKTFNFNVPTTVTTPSIATTASSLPTIAYFETKNDDRKTKEKDSAPDSGINFTNVAPK